MQHIQREAGALKPFMWHDLNTESPAKGQVEFLGARLDDEADILLSTRSKTASLCNDVS